MKEKNNSSSNTIFIGEWNITRESDNTLTWIHSHPEKKKKSSKKKKSKNGCRVCGELPNESIIMMAELQKLKGV